MSKLINNSEERKNLLKHMILQLHQGEAPERVRKQLVELLQKIPYDHVVEVEQELINEGLPAEEVLKLCDVHTQVLEGHIDQTGARQVPAGHPVDILKKENRELVKVAENLNLLYSESAELGPEDVPEYLNRIRSLFNDLIQVDKHYRKKENLLFPFLEKYGITGPPKVMWGKHDEARDLLKAAIETAGVRQNVTPDEVQVSVDMIFKPASQAVVDMTMKEEEILFPMSLDTLTDTDWYEIYRQIPEIGFCLYDPKEKWQPEGNIIQEKFETKGDAIILPSGSFSVSELTALLNTLPVDITFVNKDDKVAYFTQGSHKIFDRNRSILGRDVKLCHPPASVHIVEQILNDFKTGKQNHAPFWIRVNDRFIHIEYFAVRDEKGEYYGTIEVSQDLTEKRKLSGERRLLSYEEK
ncbi:DUF438 domain-containing protein [candidate division KSB1 bacterium]|nr:DUF438 domain-containing protein [candidate division KSB1 bacterium]